MAKNMVTKFFHSFGKAVFLFPLLTSVALSSAVAKEESSQYQELEWTQLMPEDDLEALMNPPDYLAEIQDGSQQDSLDAFGEKEFSSDKAQRFQEALTSTTVIEEFANKSIRIPGFVVPLATTEDQRVTEFFIVPYFGACLHMPPPPPNQIIYASVKEGIEIRSLYEPLWFEGLLIIEMTKNATGASAYRLKVDNFFPYDD